MEVRVFDPPEWVDGKNVNEMLFSWHLMKKRQLVVHNGRFFGINGIVEDEQVKLWIAESLYAVFTTNLEKRASVLLKSLRMFGMADNWKPDPDLIHVKNGTLNVKTRLFEPKWHICHSRLPVRFEPEAPTPERWLDFLSQLLPAEDIPTLQEYMGYCLIPSTCAQRMLMLVGRGGEGKSRIGVVLSALLGGACCRGSIRKIEVDRFAPATLEGRLVMVDDDIDMTALPSTNTLKTIVTAETPVDLERKGVQSYQGVLYSRFLCFGNGALSSLYDHSDGFYRRQIVLHTLQKPPGRVDDPFLAEKLLEELPGIFLWCLEGLKRLQDNNYKFTVSEFASMNMRAMRRETDTVLDFMESEGYLTFDPKAKVASSVLYRCYESWCRDNSCKPFTANTFTSHLRDHEDDYNIAYTNNVPLGGGRRVRGFLGVEPVNHAWS